ncbi:MAG TPA: phasin family protein [Anaerolineae bacterium]|nr:phasin family protein [Anaerolineae bacterium]
MGNVIEQIKPEVEKAKEAVVEEGNKLQDAMHRMMLALVGTVGLVQDELEHLVDKAVERGEQAEKEARQTVHDVTEKRKGAEKEVDKRFEDMLAKLNIPTKNDITALNEKIAELAKKVEALKN